MCYEASQLALKILKDAKRIGAPKEEIEQLKEKVHHLKGEFERLYRASGYDHPKMYVFCGVKRQLELSEWGLIPEWIDTEEKARDIQNKTLNARIETLFEKKAYKDSAHEGRCIVPLEGFYEYHHKNGQSFSHFITHPEQNLLVAGIRSKWKGKSTFSMVTTRANAFMEKVHNNPKRIEPRMPLILQEHQVDMWLHGTETEIVELSKESEGIELVKRTVKPLKGKLGVGNVPEAQHYFFYKGMEDIPTLFD